MYDAKQDIRKLAKLLMSALNLRQKAIEQLNLTVKDKVA